MAAGSSVKDPQAAAEQARAEVQQAEAELASGGRGITAEALHKLRDRWRHAELTAKGAAARAQQEARQARLDGLAAIGDQVDALAASDPAAAIHAGLRDVAEAAARVRQLAAEHDTGVAELVAAAEDLEAEPMAPGGPRGSSSHVAVSDGIVHKTLRLVPVGHQAEEALRQALAGDVDAAASEVRPVASLRPAARPDHLVRGRGGMLMPVYGDLGAQYLAQLRSGDLVALSAHEIDRYMSGELS